MSHLYVIEYTVPEILKEKSIRKKLKIFECDKYNENRDRSSIQELYRGSIMFQQP
jgi:hypothetical protein